jgi:branched-chain amino acid transport system ATP-binding protein
MMLRVDNITVSYGTVAALRDVSIEVAEREIVTVIGANGAGKSTMLNALLGLVPLVQGSIWLGGTRTDGLPAHRLVSLGLGYVPEGRELFGPMSVMDNLLLGAYNGGNIRGLRLLSGMPQFRRQEAVSGQLDYVFQLFPRLKERQKQRAQSLSGGEQQMLAVGRALMSRPRLLVLDEPSLGLAPQVVREILGLLRKLREEGLAVLLVEQDAVASLKVADRGYIMERGRIIMGGTAKALMNDDRVRQAYLGKAVA